MAIQSEVRLALGGARTGKRAWSGQGDEALLAQYLDSRQTCFA
jgi:hypothetical protein